jgi:hypothetical protein
MRAPCRPHATLIALAVAALACGGDSARGPACGMALTFGPTMIRERFLNPLAVIVEAPVGLPPGLPARVAGRADPGGVEVSYQGRQLVMEYRGAGFPARPGYALLVVDDTSQRAMGVLIYDADPPTEQPRIGSVRSGDRSVGLYGVLVDWTRVSNPRCPLLGTPASTPRDS